MKTQYKDKMKLCLISRSVWDSFVKRFLLFGRNSDIHGLKYVFQESGTLLSRLTWLAILIVFAGCLYLLLVPVIQRGGSVSFTPDTRYLNWNTKFPGVTVCEKYTAKTVQKKMFEEYPDLLSPLNFDYRRYVADLMYGRGTCSRTICLPCGNPVPCNVSWRNIIDNVHKKCDELIVDCHFNNEKFSCAEHFYKVDSEYGSCFSFNSLQGGYIDDLQFVVNRSTGPGVLSFRLLTDAQISVHSTEELSTNVLDKKFKFEVNTYMYNVVDYLFSIVEIDNEPALKYEDIDVRKCRYNYEIPESLLHTYQVYSYGACRLAQITEKSFSICGCVHPVRDLRYQHMYCNYTGMNCLVSYEAQKKKLGVNDDSGDEDCLPSCVESEISTIYVSKRRDIQRQNNGSSINIWMTSLPTMRYQKNLLRTNLDFVVTVGGMAGLFFSASILSIAEVLYLILRSPNK